MSSAEELFLLEREVEQNFSVQLYFIPLTHLTKAGRVLLAKKRSSDAFTLSLHGFLCSLMAGNVFCHCHNCGRHYCTGRDRADLSEGWRTQKGESFHRIESCGYRIPEGLQFHIIITAAMKIKAATTACCFQVRLKYPTNSRINAFSVKYHFVLAPKPTHSNLCCFARSSARNT